MIHNLQTAVAHAISGLMAHMGRWDGWAVLIAAGLFGFRSEPLWVPLIVALIINPSLYGLVSGLVHGRHVSLDGVAFFTLYQIVVAYIGYAIGRLIRRFR